MRHVLVVDDEPALCAVLREALSPEFAVTCAGSATEALRLLDGVDLAVIDVVLPDASGLDVARVAMAAGVTALLVSGHPEQCRRLEEVGCPCIAKPYRLAALLARVRALLFDGTGHVAACRAALDRLGAAV
jgi:two-component system response regulator MprA